MYRADTIVACATPAGRGAVAVVRCSGAGALAVAQAVFRPRRGSSLRPWRMHRGDLVGRDGEPIDDALAVFFPSPRSATGEDTVEFHCHGSPILVDQVIAAAVAAGARLAEPGEFTRRAVLNGKIDLLQAEAVSDLVSARAPAGAKAAWRQLQGALSGELGALRESIVQVLAHVEADVDFTDDDLPEADHTGRVEAIRGVIASIEGLIRGFPAARRAREGTRVVFTGKPNAGKSSLVNRLLGTRRMIVSEEAGTTRDAVEETLDLDGVAVVLTDTAGIHDAVGPAEAEAVRLATEIAAEADLCVVVIDASGPASEAAVASLLQLPGGDSLLVLNKADAAGPGLEQWRRLLGARGPEVLVTSARTGEGCDALAAAISASARRGQEGAFAGTGRLRHRAALEEALGPLERALGLVAGESGAELAAMELRGALAGLSSIVDPLGDEELLDRIFSQFCLGK